MRGQTYERAAIEDWFTTHKTDPMTGETLLTTALYPDLVMKMACDRQRAAAPQRAAPDHGGVRVRPRAPEARERRVEAARAGLGEGLEGECRGWRGLKRRRRQSGRHMAI